MLMAEAKAAMIAAGAASGFISSRTLVPLGERCEDAWYVFPNEQYVHLLGRAGLADKDLLLASIQAGTWGERIDGNWIPRAGSKGGWIDASEYRELDPADIAARGQDWPTIFDAKSRGIGE